MADAMSAVIWGVITFSLLVLIHEGGHFVAARSFGVKVHEFMIGLPGPAIRIKGRKTVFGVTAIPLGGYVRIAGMEPGAEDPRLAEVLAIVTRAGTAHVFDVERLSGIEQREASALLDTLVDWGALEYVEVAQEQPVTYRSLFEPEAAHDPVGLLTRARSYTYRGLTYPKRVVVLVSGVMLNLLTAIIVFTTVLSVWGYWRGSNVLKVVSDGSAAASAGLRPGDEVKAIGDERVAEFEDLVSAVDALDPGDVVTLTYRRADESQRVQVTMGEDPSDGSALLGVAPEIVRVKPSVLQSLGLSFHYIGLTFKAIAGFFNPDTFQESVSGSTSVIGAAVYTAEAAKSGPLDYAGMIALLSLSLGAINLFPIPPLDGGKVAVETVELLRGRPLPKAVSLGLSFSGAILLFALIGYLMYADVVRIISG